MKMYGSLSDEDLNEWERLPLVMRVLCSAQMGAWLLRRDENKEKSEHKTGRWIKQNYGWNWQCSECGFVTPPSAKEIFTFCPKCGAKMVEPQESEVQE